MKEAIFALLFATGPVFAETAWPGVEYKEVRAYAWKIDRSQSKPLHRLIREDMSLVEGVINKEGALLNKAQVKRLLSAQARPAKDRLQAMCYLPHNLFVFYTGEKKPVAYLEVCFDCLKSHAYPKSVETDPDYVEIAKICAELNLPIGLNKTVAGFRESTDWLYDPSKLKK